MLGAGLKHHLGAIDLGAKLGPNNHGAKIYGTELGAKIYGAKLGAKVTDAELTAMSSTVPRSSALETLVPRHISSTSASMALS